MEISCLRLIPEIRRLRNRAAQSRHTGTEVSGLLGYGMLSILEVKLDYRDGLVEFVYDPKRVNVFLR